MVGPAPSYGDATLFGNQFHRDKIAVAVERIKQFCPPEGYYLAFSGGKDSQVLRRLADMSGVQYDAHYSVTTIDPPELVRFIRREYPDTAFDHPDIPLLRRLETKGFPLRQSRWCCALYKETGGHGRTVLLGLRAAESYSRSKRQMVEHCFKGGRDKRAGKVMISPIIDWSDDDVWQFIRDQGMPYCELYDQGYTRLGCVFCPMASQKRRERDALRYPRMAQTFIRSFEKLHGTGRDSMKRWANGEEMFWWWIRGTSINALAGTEATQW